MKLLGWFVAGGEQTFEADSVKRRRSVAASIKRREVTPTVVPNELLPDGIHAVATLDALASYGSEFVGPNRPGDDEL